MFLRSNKALSFVLAVLALAGAAGAAYLGLRAAGFFEIPASASVTSTPTGALVLLDGVPTGVTPLELTTLAPGEHEFRLILDGYLDFVRLEPVVGEVRLEFVLEPRPMGTVAVVSDPDGARVFCNGTDMGFTPLTFRIEPGRHTLSLIKENFDEVLREVVVASEATALLDVKLDPTIETYYARAMAAEPNNLQNYCDIMRYYYVKQRWVELGDIISRGFDIFFGNEADKDSKARFIQEIGKVRTDDPRLYTEVVFPAITDQVVGICTRHPDRPEVLDALLFGKRGSAEGLDLLFGLIAKYPEVPGFRRFLTQRSSASYTFLRSLKDDEFKKISDIILASDKVNLSKQEQYDIFRNFALTCSSLKRFDYAEQAQRKAIASFPEGSPRKDLMMLKYQLVVSLRNQSKVTELRAYIEELLADPTTEPVYRRIFEAELKKLK